MNNSSAIIVAWDVITIRFNFQNNSQEQQEACKWITDMRCHQVVMASRLFFISSFLNKNYKRKTVSTFLLLEFSAHWLLIHLLKENLYYMFYITCELFILLAFKLNLTMFHLNWKGMLNSRLRHYYWRWLHDFLVP